MKKTEKLLDRLVELMSSKKRKQAAELDTLKELLDKLKKRQKKLEAQLEEASGSKEKQLRRDIAVVKAQRKKGLARYRKLVEMKGE
jgi:hypothetical protein